MTTHKMNAIKAKLADLMREFEDVSEDEQCRITQTMQTVQEKLSDISQGLNIVAREDRAEDEMNIRQEKIQQVMENTGVKFNFARKALYVFNWNVVLTTNAINWGWGV